MAGMPEIPVERRWKIPADPWAEPDYRRFVDESEVELVSDSERAELAAMLDAEQHSFTL